MEKFMPSEALMLEPASYGHFPRNSPRTPKETPWNLDFDDVFGGPPRRYSMQDARAKYSFGEITDSGDDEISSSPWGAPKEKPVFGQDIVGMRRHPCDDFYEDIFRGDESHSSPRARSSDRDRDSTLGTNPVLRTASPVAPKVELLGTSVPTHSSFASKSTTMEFPPGAAQNNGQFKMDGGANRLNSYHSSSSSSRFYQRSPLASFSSEDSSSTATSDQKDTGNIKSVDSPVNNQFHFSIYKWAGKGVPTFTALIDRKNFKDKGRNARSASSNGKLEGDFSRSESAKMEDQDLSTNVDVVSPNTRCDEKGYRSEGEVRGPESHADHDVSESKSVRITKNSSSTDGANQDGDVKKINSLDDIEKKKEVENKAPFKSEVNVLDSSLADVKKSENALKENKTSTPIREILNVRERKNVKKNEEGMTNSNTEDAGKRSLKNSALNSSVAPDKREVKGKVKEFVQIFNHETGSRSKPETPTPSQSNGMKGVRTDKREYETNLNGAKSENTARKVTDVLPKVDKDQNKDEARLKSQTKTASFRKSSRRDSENPDDPFEDYFMVQELSPDVEKLAETDKSSEDTKALDAKIHQWSIGKKGNIRSLLSTLQLVLWPGNGWKPVALVDLIEANAVKRAYQKALLRLHPDKLQQNGAASHQKYIAEKVFDILQEAWDQFNTLTPL